MSKNQAAQKIRDIGLSTLQHDSHRDTSKEHPEREEHKEEAIYKRAHPESHDEEPWLVSYADMMTLLFGFFVLMYSFASAKEGTKQFEKIRKQLAEEFGGKYVTAEVKQVEDSPPVITSSSYSSDWEIGTNKDEGEGKKELMRKRGLREMTWANTSPYKELQIMMPIEKVFENTNTTFTPEGKAKVSQLAKEFLQNGKNDKLIVEVHGIPSGTSPEQGLQTSSLQASLLVSELVQRGVPISSLTAGGYGNLLIQSKQSSLLQTRGLSLNGRNHVAIFRIQKFIDTKKPDESQE